MVLVVKLHQHANTNEVMFVGGPPPIPVRNGRGYAKDVQLVHMAQICLDTGLQEQPGRHYRVVVDEVETKGIPMVDPGWWDVVVDGMVHDHGDVDGRVVDGQVFDVDGGANGLDK